MELSDFDAQYFWPTIKQFVIDKGVEPISLGEGEAEIWGKILAAMAANDTPLSLGMDEGQIKRTLNAALAAGGGVPVVPSGFQLIKGADGLYLKGADGAYLYGRAA